MTNGDTVRLAYEERGAGDIALVLLHGFPLDRSVWRAQLAGLQDHARVIAPDLRGLGESPAAPPWTMDAMADDVAALLDSLGIQRAVIGGLSLGGYVAFAMWRRHRDRVAALLLADTRATADSDDTRGNRRALAALAERTGALAVAERQVTGLLGKTTRAKRPDLVLEARAMMERAPVPGIVGVLSAMSDRPDSTSDLATIDVPTLIVVGDEDAITPPRDARVMRGAIRGAELHEIAGAGHLSPLERPAAFNAIVGEWLERLHIE